MSCGSDIGMTCLPLSMMNTYGWKILHRTFQFPDIINFITTRCQQLFAKHLLLNITLFYALLHSFFQIFTIKTPQKPDQNRTRAWVRSGSGPVRSGSGIFQSGPVRFRCNTKASKWQSLFVSICVLSFFFDKVLLVPPFCLPSKIKDFFFTFCHHLLNGKWLFAF